MEGAGLLPFGVRWPETEELRERSARERQAFDEWIPGLDVPETQRRVLDALLGLVDDVELVDARCAGVTDTAEVARRAGVEDVDSVLEELVTARLLTLHPAADVFAEPRPGMVFRIRRPDVVLTIESAGPLWQADAWNAQVFREQEGSDRGTGAGERAAKFSRLGV